MHSLEPAALPMESMATPQQLTSQACMGLPASTAVTEYLGKIPPMAATAGWDIPDWPVAASAWNRRSVPPVSMELAREAPGLAYWTQPVYGVIPSPVTAWLPPLTRTMVLSL